MATETIIVPDPDRGDFRLLLGTISPEGGRGERRARETDAVERLLRSALGPDAVLAHRPDGAPCLPGHPGLCVSVSHSIHYAALAIAPYPVGIDIEEPREQLLKVAPRVFSADELRACPGLRELTRAWTLKEALYKLAPSPAACDFRANIRIDPPAVCGRVAEIIFEKVLEDPEAVVTAVREKVC